jgi:cholesterol transport system auxiliary component
MRQSPVTNTWSTKLLRLGACCAALGATSGCALTDKAEPLSPRYFSPEDPRPAPKERSADAPRWELRLGQLESASHLEERIAFRLSETELGYYEDRRWTEPPEQFLRRALFGELFERRGLRRVVSGLAPTLDVELQSFEHLRYGQPRAHLRLRFSIRDDRGSVRESSIAVEQDVVQGPAADDAQALAIAMSKALAGAVSKLADEVIAQLQREPAEPTANANPNASANAAAVRRANTSGQ